MPRSTWFSDDQRRSFPALNGNFTVDVCVVGGGITGATTAYFLKNAGLRVALLERGRCGDAETGHTTAHLTLLPDQRLHKLVAQYGAATAQAVCDAGAAAIELIQQIVSAEALDCDFVRVPAYLHAPWDAEAGDDRDALARDLQAADDMGLSATWTDCVPSANRPGIRFANQGLFHPLKFVAGVVEHVDGEGSHVFENTNVDEVDDDLTIHAQGHTISCKQVVIATHVPLMGKSGMMSATLLQSRLIPYNTYAVAARLPADTVEQASWFDTSDPYYYLRVEDRDGFQTAIFGGEDHKTGQESDTSEPYRKLVERLHAIFPQAVVTDRWSGQVIETNDMLPLIGETTEGQFVATGFAGNGMTFGVFSGMLIRDTIMDQANTWRDLFAPSRVHLRGGTWRYLKQNVDYPAYLVKDRLVPGKKDSIDDVPAGSGRVLRLEAGRAAVYRDTNGEVHCCSAVCTHMGCLVHWNRAEQTWDCPCHGSRFGVDGHVIAGPAETPLEQLEPAATH